VAALTETFVPARLGTAFRWLLASSWSTNLGDGVAMAAGPLLVASLTPDPLLVALAAGLRWAPPLLFGLWAGVLSDRLDRRRIIVVADSSRVVVLVAMVTLMVTGTMTVGAALLGLGLIATAEVFADNTSQTLLPMLVGRDDLALANARLQTGFLTLNQLAGPPIGATLFAAGRAWPFATQAVLVAAGVLLVLRVGVPPHPRAAGRAASVRHEVAEGFRWVLGHAAVRTLALTILVFNVTFGAAWSVLVLYADQRLGLGAVGFGLLTTASAIGGIGGTAAYGWITRRVSLGDIMRIGLVIETLTHLALAATRSAWFAIVVFVVFGAHAFVWGTTSTTVRQRAVPAELQGRVGGVYVLAVYGGLVVGSGVGGLLAARYGVTAPFWFAFAGSALFLVLLWGELSRIAHDDPVAAEAPDGDSTGDPAS
jgi:predicted MFS family arabinose efflux permease